MMRITVRQRLGALILIMAGVTAIVGGTGATLLYRRSLEQHRGRLVELAKSQARLIESVARFDALHSIHDHPDGPAAATLSQIEDADEECVGFGKTGEFTLARREGDRIIFLLAHRHGSSQPPEPVPFDSDRAEPMRQALLGNSGTLVGQDYRGHTVLAAYEPVRGTKWGIVTKIDVAEIHAPFVTTAVEIGLVAFAAAVAGALLFVRITNPLITKLQTSEQRYSALVNESPDPIVTVDRSGRFQSANPAAELVLGHPERQLIGKQFSDIGVLTSESLSKAQSELRHLMLGEDRLPFELTLTSPGDMPVTVEVNTRPIREGEEVVGVHAILRNITGRKLMEEALRESERELAIRNAVAQVCLTIPDDDMYGEVLGIILEATQSPFGVFGYIDEAGALVVPSMPPRVRQTYHIRDEKIVLPRREWDNPLWVQAIQRKEALHSNEPSAPTPLARVALKRSITVPIVYQGQVAGLLQVASKDTDYNYHDFRLLEMVASAVAPILRTRFEKASHERKRKRAEEALRRQKDLLSHIIANVPHSVFWKDQESTYLGCNENFARDAGIPGHRDIVGKTDYDLAWKKEEADWYRQCDREVMERGEPLLNIEESQLQADGTQATVLTSKVPLRDAEGQVVGILGIYANITDRKRTDEKIRKQSAVLEAINKVLREALTCETEEEVARQCLAVAEELTGSKFGFVGEVNEAGLFDTTAISNPGWDACTMPDSEATRLTRNMPLRGIDRSTVLEERSRIVNDPSSHPDSVGVPEGHPRVSRFLGVPLKHAGETIGMIGLANKESAYDLTDQEAVEALSVAFVEALNRKRTEAALRESEEKFRMITASAQDAVIMMDHDGNVSYWNDAAEAIFGYTRAEAVGQYLHTFLAPDRFHEDHFRAFPWFRESGHGAAVGRTLELAAVRKNGEEFPIELSMSAVRIKGEWQSIGILRDVTDRKHAEEERIHHLQIEQERNHLRDAVRALERVLGVVGHELRTPLAAIRAMAELLLQADARQTAETDSFLRGIHEEIVRMSGLVNDLLDVARLSSGTAPWNWSVVRVADACQAAIDSVSPLVDREAVHLNLDVCPPDLELEGDGSAVRRLVLNLLHNAHKHTSHGSIGVQARRVSKDQHDWVELKVRDTGEGMTPEITQRLGVAFALNSGVVGESHVKGSGLGLAVCRGIVAAHGGTISMETAPGVGTAVTVLLRADLPEPAPVEEAAHIVCEVLQ